MKKIVAALLGLLALLPVIAAAAQVPAAEAALPVYVTCRGRGGQSFTVTLEPLDEDAPMPPESSLTVTAADGDTACGSFVIRCTAPGIYHYRVTQQQGGAAGVTYDATVYYVTLTVYCDAQGALQWTAAVRRGAADAAVKSDRIVFRNRVGSRPPADPGVPPGGKLIQTGQLRWPIPVLGSCGAALVLAGGLGRRRVRRSAHD